MMLVEKTPKTEAPTVNVKLGRSIVGRANRPASFQGDVTKFQLYVERVVFAWYGHWQGGPVLQQIQHPAGMRVAKAWFNYDGTFTLKWNETQQQPDVLPWFTEPGADQPRYYAYRVRMDKQPIPNHEHHFLWINDNTNCLLIPFFPGEVSKKIGTVALEDYCEVT